MPEKRKQAVRRKLSGLLAVTMLFGAVFNHFWGRMFYATSPDVATGSDAVRNGIVSLTNLPAEDVQVIVMSDEGGYEQGGSYCVDVYIKNDTAETIEDASLNYSATSIEKESVYFEDLSVDVGTEDPITIITDTDRTEGTDEIPAPTAGQTGVTEGPTDPTAEPTGGSGELTVPTAGQTGVTEESTDPTVEPTGMTEAPTDPTAEPIQEGEGTKPTPPAGEKAGSSAGDIVTEGADEDEDMDQGDDSDDEEEEEPWRLTELTIQPGQSYHVQFYFQVKESIKGTKSQTIEFIFRWKDEEGKHRSTKGTFHYVVGAMNLLPVEVLNPYLLETDQAKKLYAGGKGEMLIDFELGGVWEIIEEEEIKAGDVDIPEADEPVSTKSDAEKADPSDQGTASVSDAKIATPPQASTDEKLDDYTNGTIQWGEETNGKPIVEKVKCDVDTYGIRLTDFRLAPREEEDEYGTTARCTFRVSKDVKPGTYYGTVTANYTFKNKRFTSSQGFAIQVAMIDDEAVAAVVALIDDLPEMEEIAEAQEAYLMSDDEDGWDAYYTELTEKVVHAYQEYIALTEEQQELVYNRDKLLAMESIWSVMTLDVQPLPEKNNGLVPFKGEDTNGLITVNLYDYTSGINEKYIDDKQYPGFQQDYGLDGYSSIGVGTAGFGNDIVTDLGAGKRTGNSSVTHNLDADSSTPEKEKQAVFDSRGWINAKNRGSEGTINRPIVTQNRESAKKGTYLEQPLSGVIKEDLDENGYPVLAQNNASLGYLFGGKKVSYVKTVGTGIDGLFQYGPYEANGQTRIGYHFNSRDNHAQYNPKTNRFDLYNEWITSDYRIYPFGNFLPLNDINTQTTHAIECDQDYFLGLIERAKNKIGTKDDFGTVIGTGNDQKKGYSSGSKYQKLVYSLELWMGKMGTNKWTALDTMEYFGPNGDGPSVPFDWKSVLDDIYSIDYDTATNFFFGMDMEMKFRQPSNGLVDGELMQFYFTGDDDVWVFVDGRLFLDLSGIHRHVGGEIDFTSGKVNYYELLPGTGDVEIGHTWKSVPFSRLVADPSILNSKGTFEDGTVHDFKFFYMERGAGSGVCRMNFNMELVNALSVEKELSLKDGDNVIELTRDNMEEKGLLGDPDYSFQVLRRGSGALKDDPLFIGANEPYIVYDKKVTTDADGKQVVSYEKVGEGVTDDDGVFCIKAGQKAGFADVDTEGEEVQYYVRELFDEDVYSQYGDGITVSGISGSASETSSITGIELGNETFTGVASPPRNLRDNTNTAFIFNNQIQKDKLGSLEIKKTVTLSDGTVKPSDDKTEFVFEVTLDGKPLKAGTPYKVLTDGSQTEEPRTAESGGTIRLKAGQTAQIDNIIAGSKFTVEEVSDSTKGYDVTYTVAKGDAQVQTNDKAEGTIKAGDKIGTIVKVTNKERETSVEIPVAKTLQDPDGQPHTYIFGLWKIEDESNRPANGTAPDLTTDPPISLQAGATQGTATFAPIKYLEKDYLNTTANAPHEHYYLVKEIVPDSVGDAEKNTIFDTTEYVVRVQVYREIGADGKSAELKTKVAYKKDGTDWRDLTNDAPITFTNIIGGAELPETGGPGTFWYTFSGVAMMAIALMYDTFRRRKRRPVRS